MAGARARTRLGSLLRTAGAEPVQLEPGELDDLEPLARLDALVHDLRPLDGAPAARLRGLRERFPGRPVLLHPPPRPGAGEALLACGEMRQVRARLQLPGAGAVGGLREAVRWLVRAPPPAAVEARVAPLLADAPDLVRRYVRGVLGALARERRAGRVTVTSAADPLPASLRTLQRSLKRAGLPPPKELRDWLVLLVLARGADRSGVRASDVARSYGLDGDGLYRLRKRLLGRSPDASLDEVRRAFAARIAGHRQRGA